MKRCLELAGKGMGLTRSNPLVGSVIVYDNRIIGEGYHHEYGGPHAEVNAINSVKDKSLLTKASLYVNLEPCSHHGKTPPCSLLINSCGIPRVVIGCKDPNPEVSGKGIAALKNAGCEVIEGILENEARYLNRRFITYHEKKRPYVILKWAQTLDGFIDTDRKSNGINKPSWITNHTARMLVHKWRSEELSIMAGTDTILLDDPGLDVREWPGINPIRVIPDKNGRIFEDKKVKNGLSPTLIFRGKDSGEEISHKYDLVSLKSFDIPSMLEELYQRELTSLFVEGGAKMLGSFLNSGLWDETYVFFGNKMFKYGVKAPELNRKADESFEFRGSMLYIYKNNQPENSDL